MYGALFSRLTDPTDEEDVDAGERCRQKLIGSDSRSCSQGSEANLAEAKVYNYKDMTVSKTIYKTKLNLLVANIGNSRKGTRIEKAIRHC